ncbi:MAG: hypothetical protein OEZ59_07970 [Deltaproteobacteria bacterium]|nr:hypothetical protein [Deltaproteobacteria bacterium]
MDLLTTFPTGGIWYSTTTRGKIARKQCRNRMKKNHKQISEKELGKAIQKFLEQGGMIKKLPDQKEYTSRPVGMKYGASGISGESLG